MKLYFAYGSNMWREQMKQRCLDPRSFGKGILKGFRWIITSRGYANIIRSEADEVHGVVYRLSEDDELVLDKHEGVMKGAYRKEMVNVEIENLNYSCLTYIDPVCEEGKPKEEYRERIRKAVADAGLHPEYIERHIRRFIPDI